MLKPISLLNRFAVFSALCSLNLLCSTVLAEPVKVKVIHIEGLKDSKKIILGNFVVEFQKRYESVKTGFSIMGLGNAGSSTTYNDTLLPDPEVLTAITNHMRELVVKELSAKGFEVIEPAAITHKDAYEKILKMYPIKNGTVLPNMDGESVLYAPDGYQVVVPWGEGCTHFIPKPRTMDLSRLGETLKHAGATAASGGHAQYEAALIEAEGAPVLKVWMTVGFGEATAAGGNAAIIDRQKTYWGTATVKQTVGNSANGAAKAGMFLKPGVTHFAVRTKAAGITNGSCGISFSRSTMLPPADGNVQLQLEEKYVDDGSPVASLSHQAGTVAVNDTALGNHLVTRMVKENADGTQAGASAGGNGVKVSLQSTRTSGAVDTKGLGTSLNTQANYVSEIGADLYATSAVKMMHDVVQAFVGKLQP
ncbi:MAG: hypothetical protein IPG42_03420 [Betaproteobacteria bacterium]|jgi:hypothetical protein|nr:hypothetical protein [Betaproteobacteria bacterium]MBP6645655.1 hypothetical protein [Burkholderiaceae bacterium]